MWYPTTLTPEGGIHAYCSACHSVACPSCRMFSAALWSRCRLVPHSGHACQRTERPFCTIAPQPCPEHRWLLNAGLTATTCFPALAALKARIAQERAPPRIADAFGEAVIPEHIGHPQVFMVDHVVRLDELAGLFGGGSRAAAGRCAAAPWRGVSPLWARRWLPFRRRATRRWQRRK